MALFITRIELNGNPTWQDYDNLHKAMKRAGFSRLITSNDGAVYHLPSAEYSRSVDLTTAQVRDQAHIAAKSAWNDVQTLTTQGDSAWNGLRPATPAEITAA
jgi:hypothetical protein